MGKEGMIGFAGGLPHPSLFPFQKITVDTYPADLDIDASVVVQDGPLDKLEVSKVPRLDQPIDLAAALQYGDGAGHPAFQKWLSDFTRTVFQPAYDFEILANSGNTDAWNKVVKTFCERGEYILCEEYTFSSAQTVWIPMGCRGVPVAMDAGGLSAIDLERVLSSWNVTHPGIKRPHVLYIVPVGSNPTGSTMQAERRKAVYDVCVQYDVLICEDDPYSFLQFSAYGNSQSTPRKPQDFLEFLAPSFLKYDYQGRVIRLDTFSKTLGPGLRLGYFVCNKMFRQRLLQATQMETQTPSGLSQAVVMSLLSKWGPDGYLQWLANTCAQYQLRRDWMIAAFEKSFRLIPAEQSSIPSAEGLVAYAKFDTTLSIPLFSFIPPAGGMFIWTKFYFKNSPRFVELKADPTAVDPEQAFEHELWLAFAESLVLLGKGTSFVPWQGEDKISTAQRGAEIGVGHFRLAFSYATKEIMEEGMERLAKVVSTVWRLH